MIPDETMQTKLSSFLATRNLATLQNFNWTEIEGLADSKRPSNPGWPLMQLLVMAGNIPAIISRLNKFPRELVAANSHCEHSALDIALTICNNPFLAKLIYLCGGSSERYRNEVEAEVKGTPDDIREHCESGELRLLVSEEQETYSGAAAAAAELSAPGTEIPLTTAEQRTSLILATV